MSLPLRITFDGDDYTYTVLTRMITKDTSEITISLNDQEITLARNARGEWDVLDGVTTSKPGLVKAVARNLALRYRLS